MTTYPAAFQQLTAGSAPAVCAASSLAADFDDASMASLRAATARARCAVLSNVYLESGELGAVDGLGKVAVQALLAPAGAALGAVAAALATFGTVATPTSTTVSGAAVQPAVLLLPVFDEYQLPPTTPHLSHVVATAPVFAGGSLVLPETLGTMPFPPPGYRLFVHNLDATSDVTVQSPFAAIQELSGALVAPSPALALPGGGTASLVWTGAEWLASLS